MPLLAVVPPACHPAQHGSRHGSTGRRRTVPRALPTPLVPPHEAPHSQLSHSYNPRASPAFFRARPWLVAGRAAQAGAVAARLAWQMLLARGQHAPAGRQGQLLRAALVALGPTAIKLGQTLSARPDLVGEELCEELALLQDSVEPFSSELALAILEEELGAPAPHTFARLTEQPVASASLGQVYRGRLRGSGLEVAVKVQRPGALAAVLLDIHILRAALGGLRSLAGIRQDIRLVADELGRGLCGELDYRQEAANMEAFAAAHAELRDVAVPAVVVGLATRRVLVSHWVEGESPRGLLATARAADGVGGPAAADAARARLRRMVAVGVECSLAQLLVSGVMHADPHPGNLRWRADGTLVYLDHGLLSFVQPKHSQAMFSALVHLVLEDYPALVADLDRLDLLKPATDRDRLASDLRASLASAGSRVAAAGGSASVRVLQAMAGSGRRGGATLAALGVSWGQLGGVLVQLALRYRFQLPPYFTLVARSLTTLEGLALQVDPDYQVLHAALPTLGRELLRRGAARGERRHLVAQLLLDEDRGVIKPDVLEAVAFALACRRRRASPPSAGASPGDEPSVHPGQLAGLMRVVYDADLAGILRQLCSRRAAELRRAAAAWLLSAGNSGTECNPRSAEGRDRPSARKRRLGRRCRRYAKLLLGKLWRRNPSGVTWAVAAALLLAASVLRARLLSALEGWRSGLRGQSSPRGRQPEVLCSQERRAPRKAWRPAHTAV